MGCKQDLIPEKDKDKSYFHTIESVQTKSKGSSADICNNEYQ